VGKDINYLNLRLTCTINFLNVDYLKKAED
jgi:hypothetical protein